jgi:hypothetical protein
MRESLVCFRSLPMRPMLPFLTLALGACGGDSGVTGTTSRQPCGSASVVALAALQSATIDCTTGTVIQLTGGGAHYLVVPEFATSNVTDKATSYVIADSDAVPAPVGQVIASRAPFASISASAARGTSLAPGALQRQFDALLRAKARNGVSTGQWTRPTASTGSSAARSSMASFAVIPPAGSIRTFKVINTFNATNPTYATVNAKLLFIGTNTLVYVDTMAPANGFNTSQLNAFGQQIDQTFYTIDVNAFGPPSDVDGNGRVIVLLSPVVNSLSPSAQCATQGYIAGFFFGLDLSGAGNSNSNQGEIYYGLVPDPNGTVSCAHSVSTVASIAPGTFLHELQHMINFSQHVVVHGGNSEEGWLDEGLSIVAQELGSEYYEQRFPPPTGRTNPNQLLPDSAEGFIADQFVESYDWLLDPDTTTLTLHSDSDGGLQWRAADWLFLHWLGDQQGAALYKRLEESSTTGTDNIASAAGESFQSLFGDFGLSVYTDSIPGIPKSSIPQNNKFTTRTLRTIFQAVANSGGGGGSFPITLKTLTGQVTGSMVPGAVTYYEIFTAPSVATTTLRFAPSTGSTFQSSLHPQVSVFRLP